MKLNLSYTIYACITHKVATPSLAVHSNIYTRVCKGIAAKKEDTEQLFNLLYNKTNAQVDTVANTSRHSRGALHNVAVTVGAVRGVVDNGQRAGVGLWLSRRAKGHAPIRQHLMAAHREAGPVRRLGLQLLRRRRRRLRPSGGARRRWWWLQYSARLRRAHHTRRTRPGAMRAMKAARSTRARHARPRVKVRRFWWPVTFGYFSYCAMTVDYSETI